MGVDPTVDMALIKRRLQGRSLEVLMRDCKTNKYRISKATGVSYKTLWNWQAERIIPSDKLAAIVGTYLGIIPPNMAEIIKLKEEIRAAQDRLDRIEGGNKSI